MPDRWTDTNLASNTELFDYVDKYNKTGHSGDRYTKNAPKQLAKTYIRDNWADNAPWIMGAQRALRWMSDNAIPGGRELIDLLARTRSNNEADYIANYNNIGNPEYDRRYFEREFNNLHNSAAAEYNKTDTDINKSITPQVTAIVSGMTDIPSVAAIATGGLSNGSTPLIAAASPRLALRTGRVLAKKALPTGVRKMLWKNLWTMPKLALPTYTKPALALAAETMSEGVEQWLTPPLDVQEHEREGYSYRLPVPVQSDGSFTATVPGARNKFINTWPSVFNPSYPYVKELPYPTMPTVKPGSNASQYHNAMMTESDRLNAMQAAWSNMVRQSAQTRNKIRATGAIPVAPNRSVANHLIDVILGRDTVPVSTPMPAEPRVNSKDPNYPRLYWYQVKEKNKRLERLRKFLNLAR